MRTLSHTRFLGGPRRMLSDALVWMEVAKGLHSVNAPTEIADISSLLIGEHPLISLHGSVIKYCYGFSIEMYLKWILVEAKIEYRANHNLRQLIGRLPDPVLDKLRDVYCDYRERDRPRFRIREAHVHGVEELDLDWSTFDVFIENLDSQKFIVGRYAEPREYGIFRSRSRKRSREMNSYIASNDFFALGEKILVLSQLRFSNCLRKRTIGLSCFVGSVVGGGGSDGQGQVRCAAGGGTTGRTPASDSGWETPGPSHRQGPGSPQERRRLADSPSG